jgi:phosphoglycolate phosphatase
LIEYVAAIVGRTSSDPMLLKPNPHLVTASIVQVATVPGRCTIIGDSESDMVAARRAGTKAVGYANKAGKAERLLGAGADLVLAEAFPDEIM